MVSEFIVTGVAEQNRRILNFIGAMPAEIKLGMEIEFGNTLILAQRKTPWKTGALKASGIRHPVQREGWDSSVMITFGNEKTVSPKGFQYAWFVHEDLDSNHPNGGEAKFLENALNETNPGRSIRLGRGIVSRRGL